MKNKLLYIVLLFLPLSAMAQSYEVIVNGEATVRSIIDSTGKLQASAIQDIEVDTDQLTEGCVTMDKLAPSIPILPTGTAGDLLRHDGTAWMPYNPTVYTAGFETKTNATAWQELCFFTIPTLEAGEYVDMTSVGWIKNQSGSNKYVEYRILIGSTAVYLDRANALTNSANLLPFRVNVGFYPTSTADTYYAIGDIIMSDHAANSGAGDGNLEASPEISSAVMGTGTGTTARVQVRMTAADSNFEINHVHSKAVIR